MKKAIATLSIALILLSACGKEQTYNQNKMTEAEALDTLTKVNEAEASGRSAFGKKPKVSYQELMKILQDLIAQGKIKLPNQQSRGAVSANDLSSLVNVFTALSNGGSSSNLLSLASLATSLINSAGSGSQAKFDINVVLQLLAQAAPIIAVIAPQYAGLIQAMLVILPIVVTIINMFVKPNSAMLYNYELALAKG